MTGFWIVVGSVMVYQMVVAERGIVWAQQENAKKR